MDIEEKKTESNTDEIDPIKKLFQDANREKRKLRDRLKELETEVEVLTPTTPTGTFDWYIKWIAVFFGVGGIFLASAGYTIIGPSFYLISSICWVLVGMNWQDRAIMIGSSISGTAVALQMMELLK